MSKKPEEKVEEEVLEKPEDKKTEPEIEPSEEEKFKAAFEDFEKENEKLKDKYLRLNAELENYKKRSDRERISAVKFANERLLKSLIPVLDGFDQALKSGHVEGSHESSRELLAGMKMIQKQFLEILTAAGVQEIEAVNKPFDPQNHEAMMEQPDDSVEHHTVLEEYQKGYLLNGRLVRPARVIVSKKSE